MYRNMLEQGEAELQDLMEELSCNPSPLLEERIESAKRQAQQVRVKIRKISGVGCSPRGQVTNTDETGQDVGPRGLSSHWESRVLQGSITAAALGEPAVVRVDPVTLAPLQDTDWYSFNHCRAQSLVLGEDKGYIICASTGLNRYQGTVSGSDWMDCPVGGAIEVTCYRGLVFCPDKRLCYYPDIDPTTNNNHVPHSPAASTTDPVITEKVSTDPNVSSILGVTAAVCLLAALMVAYRWYRSSRIRVYAAPEAPIVLQLLSTQCDSNDC
ncbi:unnamed protein product [Coregonus sp. 'balchen']|nr:unnamed protein product [Coregonus sp. 'balchen']